MSIIRVALDVPLSSLFDYTVVENVVVGQRVVVPFGRRQLVGMVIECAIVSEIPSERIKPVTQVLHDSKPLSAELLRLLNFCSDYYRHPIGQTVLSALPTRLRSNKPIVSNPTFNYCLSTQGQALDLDDFPKRKVVQRRILAKLAEQPCNLARLRSLSATAGRQLKELIAEGWVEQFEDSSIFPNPSDGTISHLTNPSKDAGQVIGYPINGRGEQIEDHHFDNAHTLTDEQQAAVDAVTQAPGYGCFLLHGITGSGKTEVYVHLIHEMLQRCPERARRGGGQVLLLVPEINLTPQLEQYFRSRFPDTALASLHSGLSEGERLHNWQQAQNGAAKIVLGTRLSVFAELPNLALIIVDEEHDSSFKQQDGLRYSARDVAIFRASQCGVPIVLGSATPSLESYQNAEIGRYALLRLTGRASASAVLPTVRCIHTQQTVMHHGISENLLREIEQRIARKEQSLLFINRRGYAPVMMCGDCGWLSDCRNCEGKLVLHLQDRRLRCHHCGYQIRVPRVCPDCGSVDLHPIGSGTQRIESVLQERFPEARILRVDRDSTRNKHAWQIMREQIHANEVDILVGTQMLAKGHDFPALTLVGVLNPDSALYSSDFRAAEKLFAQLVQVAGRAGRADKPGEVIIQTAFPDHPLFRALQAHDFDGWAASQLAERKMAGFPPFMYQVMLRAEGKQESEVYTYLNQAHKAALALRAEVEVLGVVPAALSRRANHFRAQLLIQANSRKLLQQFLRAWQADINQYATHRLRCTLDVDPLDF
jgi:primosomal protein N' (replication factor Y)